MLVLHIKQSILLSLKVDAFERVETQIVGLALEVLDIVVDYEGTDPRQIRMASTFVIRIRVFVVDVNECLGKTVGRVEVPPPVSKKDLGLVDDEPNRKHKKDKGAVKVEPSDGSSPTSKRKESDRNGDRRYFPRSLLVSQALKKLIAR